MVAANPDVESRTGYVYVSGHVFTITQAGVGADLAEASAEFGPEGGAGEVLVLADGQSNWTVRPESDWISVTETSGTGESYVHYTVAPFAAVSDRTGYITIAGCTFEVHQTGWDALIGIVGDEAASVTGDETEGYVLRPSSPTMSEVVVRIPEGIDPKKVTIEVSPEVARLVANGATIKVLRGEHDITSYLNLPAAVGGALDVTKSTVKDQYVKEPLDPSKGAEIKLLNPDSPSITTAPTRPGLRYTLREGGKLDMMSDGASKIGDGQPWTPVITVKGGISGFYTIDVSK